MNKLNILFKYTTRSRRNNFLRGYKSIVDNISNNENYHILISIDDDDESMKNIEINHGNYTFISGKSISKVDAINRDVNSFNYNWDILVNMSDDMVFNKTGFDDTIRSKFLNTLDRSLLFNDGNRSDIITMSILGRDYYKRDNYIYNPEYKSFFCDNEATDVAIIRGCLLTCSEEIFSHLHFAYGKAEKDNQYTHAESFWNEDKRTYKLRIMKHKRLEEKGL